MTDIYIGYISRLMDIAPWQVEHTVSLLGEGATIPFISRYRKESTGRLDEMQVAEIKHWNERFNELDKRKALVLETISSQGALTEELRSRIVSLLDPDELEDLYLPFRPKRRTRASVAKESGLEPLADLIFSLKADDPCRAAEKYLSDEVPSVEDALAGARDIIAERVSEMQPVRADLRNRFSRYGTLVTKVSRGKSDDEKAGKYRNYFDYSERLDRIASYRLLAALRAASEGIVTVRIDDDEQYSIRAIEKRVFSGRPSTGPAAAQVSEACRDSLRRLLHPSIENEVLASAKRKADIESVKVFGENLRQLLLQPPVGQKRTLAIDPGFRTGCKVVCLDAQGKLLHNETIYPHPPVNQRINAMKSISSMVEAYRIEVIAIGNGTAGRETEAFIRKIALPEGVKVFSVSEDGASIYSASGVAREEFPEYDVTVRGAVSIGRRLMDPLSELVKIDPKSLGVGQYQHDVDQNLLKDTLDDTVVSCVNSVGVNLNTASCYLLSYVSGIGPALARNIVDYRNENGPFRSRRELMSVSRLGAKAFEQCAGFLRIPSAENPLDNSAVHPERYGLVERMARDCGVPVTAIIGDSPVRDSIHPEKYVGGDVGLPTLEDILQELAKPGRDPRATVKVLEFDDSIMTIEDVREGMVLPGIVTNITAFGAFVDLGIKQNGLVHISQMGDRRVSDPSEVLKVHQHVKVRVLSVDLQRGRISLSLRGV